MKKGQGGILILLIVGIVIVGGVLTYVLLKPDARYCGDGVCEPKEKGICLADCPDEAVCGDGVCDAGEAGVCLEDCPEEIYCGDGTCNDDYGETCSNCVEDCGECPVGLFCGDGNCSVDIGEDCSSCFDDCGDCPVESGESHFGVHGGINFLDKMNEAGVEIVREWIIWKEIEPEDDVYDWTDMDAKVQAANDAGIEILGYFVFMPEWAIDFSNPKCNQILKENYLDPCDILDWDDYTEFARNVAERYDGNHGYGEMKYIGLWNEVQGFALMNSEEYEPWLRKGYQAVKQGNPNAQVLLGAVHAPLDFPTAPGFIDTMLSDDFSQYYDIFNFHIYQRADEAVLITINDIKNRMNSAGVNKPMWITETATLFSNVPCNNLAWRNEIAKGVVKRYAQAFGNGVDKVFWFASIGKPTEEEHPNGLGCNALAGFDLGSLAWDINKEGIFNERPAYDTYKLMTSKLGGFSSVEKLTDEQYKFVVNGEPVYVLWCDSGSCDLHHLVPTADVQITDYQGNELTEISLSDSPIFVE